MDLTIVGRAAGICSESLEMIPVCLMGRPARCIPVH